MPDQRKRRYLDRFGISDRDLTIYTDELYGQLSQCNAEFLACIVNKAEVQEEYKAKAHYPPAIAYECVLQRVQRCMQEQRGMAHITIDDMDGKSPKGNDWRANLRRQHKLLRKHGSRLIRGMAMDRIEGEEPAFRDSARDERLQLADLIAYSVYRQFVDHGPDWENPSKKLPVYEYLGRIGGRFRNLDGRIQGFGIVKFPKRNSVAWSVPKKKP